MFRLHRGKRFHFPELDSKKILFTPGTCHKPQAGHKKLDNGGRQVMMSVVKHGACVRPSRVLGFAGSTAWPLFSVFLLERGFDMMSRHTISRTHTGPLGCCIDTDMYPHLN